MYYTGFDIGKKRRTASHRKILCLLICFAIFIFCAGCESTPKGVTKKEESGLVKLELDGFVGEYSLKLDYNGKGDGTLFYVAELSKGSIDTFTKDGLIFKRLPYFSINSDGEVHTGGTYVDSSTTTLTVTIKASEKTTGYIYLTFERDINDALTKQGG